MAVITGELLTILDTLYILRTHHLVPAEGLVITSITDGQHMTGSKHYEGRAVDLRSKSFAALDKEAFTAILRQNLGPLFTVLLEHLGKPAEHWHIQTRKGLA
jgi:hypothetical protein